MKKIGIGLLGLSFTCLSQAGTMGPIEPDWRNVVTLSAGPVWPFGGGDETVFFSPELSRTYTFDQTQHVLAEGEIFVGKQRILDPTWEAQLGVAFAGLSSSTFTGEVWDFADPRFNNYQYRYSMNRYRGVIKGKVLGNNKSRLTKPWVSGSIGFSRNKAKNYQEWPLICEVVSLPAAYFHNNGHTDLTWSLGAGVQRVLSQNWQIGIGYEFTDWGRSHLARAIAQPLAAEGLSMSHYYTNGLLFNLTWLS